MTKKINIRPSRWSDLEQFYAWELQEHNDSADTGCSIGNFCVRKEIDTKAG